MRQRSVLRRIPGFGWSLALAQRTTISAKIDRNSKNGAVALFSWHIRVPPGAICHGGSFRLYTRCVLLGSEKNAGQLREWLTFLQQISVNRRLS
jgi:hypothetical protein